MDMTSFLFLKLKSMLLIKKISKKRIFIPLFFICFPLFTSSQDIDLSPSNKIRLVFYNLENLFDPEDDPEKRDEEFTPQGMRYWNDYRLWGKLQRMSKVLVAVGGWEPADIIGLCEIENRNVLTRLVDQTPLAGINYGIVHKESPDKRGIDVGLLYRKDRFKPISYKAIPVHFPFDPNRTTREILYVQGKVFKKDTLHIFINHWPSRYSGQLESEPSRFQAALTLRQRVDSLFQLNPNANIIITGDFNDEPHDKSLTYKLRAKHHLDTIRSAELYNLSYSLHHDQHLGSHKHQGHWTLIDQFVLSGALLSPNNPITTSLEEAHVYNSSFLLEKDEAFTGQKPFRTYIGMKFHGGYSDHLPIYIDLHKNH